MRAPRPYRRIVQPADAVRTLTYDDTLYQDASGLTLSAAAATNVDSGLTLSGEASTATGWSARVSASLAGEYTFDLQLSYTNSTIRILPYQIGIEDQ